MIQTHYQKGLNKNSDCISQTCDNCNDENRSHSGRLLQALLSISSRAASTAVFVFREDIRVKAGGHVCHYVRLWIYNLRQLCGMFVCVFLFVSASVHRGSGTTAWGLQQPGPLVVLTAHRVTLWQGSWEAEWQGSLRLRRIRQNVKRRGEKCKLRERNTSDEAGSKKGWKGSLLQLTGCTYWHIFCLLPLPHFQ